MSESSPRCESCGQPRPGKFCAFCGEKRIGPADHALRHMLGHLVEAFTHADGKIFLTLRTLVTRPGQLTDDYLRGRRKSYIAPTPLFLIANLIFFLLHPFIGGSNTLTTNLDTNLHYMWHSALATSLVAPRLIVRELSVADYAAIFNPAAVTHAKTLVILVVPIFSLAVMALYWRHWRKCVAHFVFALHVCSFWLLFICASLMLTNLVLSLLRNLHVFPSADAVTHCGTGFGLAVMAVYFFRAARVMFTPERTWVTVVKAVVLSIALMLSVQAYRLALFFITFWST